MRKFLVVSFTSEQSYTGGLQCSQRNYKSICDLFGKENTIKYKITPYENKRAIKSIFQRLFNIFKGYMGGLDDSKSKEILEIIIQERITDVFIDSSLLGKLAKIIREKYSFIRIYTFFHNIEYEFCRDYVKVNSDYFRIYWPFLALYNEKQSVIYSNKIISLNDRDAKAINKYYGRYPDIKIPITLVDNLSKIPCECPSDNNLALFVGSYFYGNVHGLKWFCDQVLPKTKIKLMIVGSGMDRFINDVSKSSQIEIYSNVPDLEPFYLKADFVILPILSGSGMKVKTAESLMYGKYIIGTEEAFMGYEITEKEGVVCNTKDDFINNINNVNLLLKFNYSSRDLFINKYSFESSLKKFESVLDV